MLFCIALFTKIQICVYIDVSLLLLMEYVLTHNFTTCRPTCISWLTCTLQRQYLQLKHNTDTDIYNRTIELYAPLNNLISLRQQ